MNKQEVTVYGNDHKETHEIYAVFASKDKRLLYIGEGLKDRHKHTFSGHSHVKALNTIHKREVPITVEVFGVKDKIRAQELEDSLIKSLQPRYNVLAKEFYLNRVVKDTLTPIFRSGLLERLKETLEIPDSNLRILILAKCESFERYFKSLQIEKKEVKKEYKEKEPLIITMPQGTRYLSDVFLEGLPENCVFDKVLTGCGGTFVAITCPKPYIIAVPTKALVKDKVENPSYQAFGLQGISEDYPLGNRTFSNCSKIIVTYNSLPALANRVNICDYHLLIDEMHMLSNMISYARDSLDWILNNFKNFKSYCFMSATVPRSSHLLEPLRNLPKSVMEWSDIKPVTFSCYLSDNIQESILQTIMEHKIGRNPGKPYIFYNSVKAITNIVKHLNSCKEYKFTAGVICADKPVNKRLLRSVKLGIASPNDEVDVMFVTATAFEGVDFFSPEGVTYIVSDRSYATTKYSIETTIPQIVGRLRNSKYNDNVVIYFNKHNYVSAKTPREFSDYLDVLEAQSKNLLETYQKALTSTVNSAKTLKGLLHAIVEDPFLEVVGSAKQFEDLTVTVDADSSTYPEVRFYPHARVAAQQTYDLFHEERFVRGDEKALGNPLSLGKLKGKAPTLEKDFKKALTIKSVGLKTICSLYDKNPKECEEKFPEWVPIIETLGTLTICNLGYSKTEAKILFESRTKGSSAMKGETLHSLLEIGQAYTKEQLTEVFAEAGAPKAKVSCLKQWFEVRNTKVNGKSAYRIIRKL